MTIKKLKSIDIINVLSDLVSEKMKTTVKLPGLYYKCIKKLPIKNILIHKSKRKIVLTLPENIIVYKKDVSMRSVFFV